MSWCVASIRNKGLVASQIAKKRQLSVVQIPPPLKNNVPFTLQHLHHDRYIDFRSVSENIPQPPQQTSSLEVQLTKKMPEKTVLKLVSTECLGLTLKGTKCKNKAAKGESYCWRHQTQHNSNSNNTSYNSSSSNNINNNKINIPRPTHQRPPPPPPQPSVASTTVGVSRPPIQQHYHTSAPAGATIRPPPTPPRPTSSSWWKTTVFGSLSSLSPDASHTSFYNRPPATPPDSPIKHKKKSQQKGHIYCYTLTNYIDTHTQDQLVIHIQNGPGSKYEKVKLSKSPFILIKIGRTTKPVKVRLKQWENHCKHPLTCLTPYNHRDLLHQHGVKGAMNNLISAMERATLDDHIIARKFPKFFNDGFFCSSHLDDIEKEIHRQLRERYGQSRVFCRGCYEADVLARGGSLNNSNISMDGPQETKGANVHVEWFLVPKIEVGKVFKIIRNVVDDLAR